MFVFSTILFFILFVIAYASFFEYFQFIHCRAWYYKFGPVRHKAIYRTKLTAEQMLARLEELIESGELAGTIKDGEVLIRLHGIIGLGGEYSRVFVCWFGCRARIIIHEDHEASRVVIELRSFMTPSCLAVFLLLGLGLLGLPSVALDPFILALGAFCGVCILLMVRTSRSESSAQQGAFLSMIREELEAESEEAE